MNNGIKEEIITKTFEETQKLGEDFARKIKPGDIIALYGDLGSGKTTFTQGLAKGLGLNRRIISPTFVIVRTYELRIKNQESGIRKFFHIDLYRVKGQDDIKGLGIEEIVNDPQNIVVIEWPEKLGLLMPKKRTDIWFEYLSDGKRKVKIESY